MNHSHNNLITVTACDEILNDMSRNESVEKETDKMNFGLRFVAHNLKNCIDSKTF